MLLAPSKRKVRHLVRIIVGHIINELWRRRIVRHRPDKSNPPALSAGAFAAFSSEINHRDIPPRIRTPHLLERIPIPVPILRARRALRGKNSFPSFLFLPTPDLTLFQNLSAL